jgi:hypothetical protein
MEVDAGENAWLERHRENEGDRNLKIETLSGESD